MQIDGAMVMKAFGLVFTAFSGLVAVIWAMLNKRIGTIEEQAQIDRKGVQGVVNNIYDEIKDVKDKTSESDKEILKAIGDVREEMVKISASSGERRAGCIEKFASKDELNRLASEVRKSA